MSRGTRGRSLFPILSLLVASAFLDAPSVAHAQAVDPDAGTPAVAVDAAIAPEETAASLADAALPELAPVAPAVPLPPATPSEAPAVGVVVEPVLVIAAPPPLPDPILPDDDAYGASTVVERPAGPGEYALAGTGSRVNAPLEELPVTVNTIESATLRERGVVDLSQALGLLPGINAPNTYGGFLEIRARGFQAITLNDGRRDARPIRAGSAPQAGLVDLDRIEVLRGPASVLYGFGSVGGVVNLIRKRASATPGYELELGLGTPGQYRVHAGAQGPISDTLSYRTDVGHTSYENFRGYKSQRNQVATTVRYQPTRRNTFNARFAYSFDHYNTDVGIPTIEDVNRPGKWVLPYGARTSARYSSNQDSFKYQRMEAALDYRYDLAKATYLELRSAITSDNYQYLAAESLTYEPPMGMQRAQVAREYLYFKRNWRPIYFSGELHSDLHTGPVLHQLVLGYNLDSFTGVSDRGDPAQAGVGGQQGDDTASLAPVDFAFPVDQSPNVTFVRNAKDHYRTATHSVYAFDHTKLTEDLFLTGGVRFDRLLSRSRRDYLSRDSGTSIPDPVSGLFRKPNLNQDSVVTGQVGLVYNFWKPVTTYVSYASGYTPQFVSPSANAVTTYNAERSQQLEGGLRLRVEQARHIFALDSAGYLIRKKNLLVPRGLDQQVPAGLAQSRGVDLIVHYVAPVFLQLDGGYSFVDAVYKKFVGPDAVSGENRSFNGNHLQMVPRHSGNFWVRGQLSKRMGVGLGSRIMGRQYADDQNRFRMPNYALFDASASYGSEHATFTVSANNILNRTDYISSVINSGNPQIQVTPGPGREILGTLRLSL
jgi:TonB-dependent siderophore receptor